MLCLFLGEGRVAGHRQLFVFVFLGVHRHDLVDLALDSFYHVLLDDRFQKGLPELFSSVLGVTSFLSV